MDVRGQELNPRNVIRAIQFFIDRVSSIICSAHWEQEDLKLYSSERFCFQVRHLQKKKRYALFQGLLESQSYRDGAALAGVVWLNAKDSFHCLGSGRVVPTLWIRNPLFIAK